MLTLGDEIRRVFSEPNPRPVYLVTIKIDDGGVEGVDEFTFATRGGLGWPVCDNVGEVAIGFDPITREVRVSSYTIAFRRDGVFQKIARDHRLKGKIVVIKLGSSRIAQSEYLTLATMVIEDLVPDELSIQLTCSYAAVTFSQKPLTRKFVNMHPYTAILAALQDAGVPASLYDTDTLLSENYPEISHWNVVRANLAENANPEGGSGLPTGLVNLDAFNDITAAEILGDLLRLTASTFLPDETGTYSIKRFDIDAATVDSWGRRDVIKFRQGSAWKLHFNEVTWSFLSAFSAPGYLTQKEEASQIAHALPGADRRIIPQTMDTEWVNGLGLLTSVLPAVAGGDHLVPTSESFRVAFAGIHGFSGARYNANDTTQDDFAELDPAEGRYAYLMLHGWDKRVENGFFVNEVPEIIRVSSIVREELTPLEDPYGSGTQIMQGANGGNYPRWLRFTLDTTAPNGGRAQFESTPNIPQAWHNGTRVADITILVDWCQKQFQRFAYGAAEIEVWTNLSKIAVQVGDFITIDDDIYLGFGKDGADTSVVFEVVSKEIRALDDSPGIRWELVWVRDDVQPDTGLEIVPGSSGTTVQDLGDWIVTNEGDQVTTEAGDWLIG